MRSFSLVLLLGMTALVSGLPRPARNERTTVSDGSTIVICEEVATKFEKAYVTVDATEPTATVGGDHRLSTGRHHRFHGHRPQYTRGHDLLSSISTPSSLQALPTVTSTTSPSSMTEAATTSTIIPSVIQATLPTVIANMPSITPSVILPSVIQASLPANAANDSSPTTSKVIPSVVQAVLPTSVTDTLITTTQAVAIPQQSNTGTSTNLGSNTAAAAAAVSGSGLKSKRGAVTNPVSDITAPLSKYDKITWDMNWWEGPPDAQPVNWQFVPQLTHFEPDQYWAGSDIFKNPSKYPYIASFLEPNVDSLSIADAVDSWRKNLEPLTSSHTVLPPMIGQNGLDWLQQFISACTGCTLGKGPVAFTVYVSTDDSGVTDFKNHVAKMEDAFPGRELWVANMGVLGTAPDDKAEWLMRQLVPYLDGHASVTRYAWNGDIQFWNKNSKTLTDLAITYATL